MKWWYWLILELLVIFGTMAWIYFFPGEIEDDFAKGMIGFGLICVIEEHKNINIRKANKMKKIKGYNIVKEKTNELLVSIEIGNDEVIERNGYKVIPFYEEGNPTIEQNAGENEIKSGVSIGGSVGTFRCWKCGRTLPISERIDFVYASNPPKYSCKECEGIKKEKQYRPFNDCNELIEYYQKKYESAVGCDIYFPSLYKPCIWLKSKEYGVEVMITGFDDKAGSVPCVFLEDMWKDMDDLFNDFTFLDGSPVGTLEE